MIYSRALSQELAATNNDPSTFPAELVQIYQDAGVVIHQHALPLLASNPQKWGEIFTRIYRLEFTNNEARELARILRSHPAIDQVDGIPITTIQQTAFDANYNQQATAYSTQLKNSLELGWLQATGNGIIVAVIDDAYEVNHEEYAGRIDYTWDVTSNSPNVAPNMPGMDHGNHVAGTIAADRNGKGIIGVAYNARLQLIKSTSIPQVVTHSLEAYEHAIASDPEVPGKSQPDIVNLSLGGYGSSAVWQLVVDAAFSKGILTVAAAGNDATINPFYPASYKNVLSVAAYTNTDLPTSFTNYGTTIDITGPGQGILSLGVGAHNIYSVKQGTSMASPFVAGVAALVMEKHPQRSLQDIINCITGTADAFPYPPSYPAQSFGSGRVNVVNAIACENISFSLDVSFDKRHLCANQGTDVTITVSPFLGWENYTYTFDFGDLSTPVTINNLLVTHTYPAANGNYRVTVTATSATSTQIGYFSLNRAVNITLNCDKNYDRCWGRVIPNIRQHVAFDKTDDSIWVTGKQSEFKAGLTTYDALYKSSVRAFHPTLINLYPDGNILYSTIIPCSEFTPHSIVTDDKGYIYISGEVISRNDPCTYLNNYTASGTYQPQLGETYALILKLNRKGAIQWAQRIGNQRDCSTIKLAISHDNKKIYTYTRCNGSSPSDQYLKYVYSQPTDPRGIYISNLDTATGFIKWTHDIAGYALNSFAFFQDSTTGKESLYFSFQFNAAFQSNVNIPTPNAFQTNYTGPAAVLVCLDASDDITTGGGTLLYATYFGTCGNDSFISVDHSGVYFSGSIRGTSSWVPITAGAHHELKTSGFEDTFLTKFTHDLSQIHWSTYVGTSAPNWGTRTHICPQRGDVIMIVTNEAKPSDRYDVSPNAYRNTPPRSMQLSRHNMILQRFSSDGFFLEGTFIKADSGHLADFSDINKNGDIIVTSLHHRILHDMSWCFSHNFRYTIVPPFLKNYLYSSITRFSYKKTCPQKHLPASPLPLYVDKNCEDSKAVLSWQDFCGSHEGTFLIEMEHGSNIWIEQTRVHRYETPSVNISLPVGKSRWRVVFVPPNGRLGSADEGASDVISEEVEIICCALSDSTEQLIVCGGDQLTLGAPVATHYSINWRDENGLMQHSSETITIDTHNITDFPITRNYLRTVTDTSGCITLNRFEVIINPNKYRLRLPASILLHCTVPSEMPFPEISKAPDYLVMMGHPGAGWTFEWSPAIGLDDPTAMQPIVTATQPTNYTLKVTTPEGCVLTATTRVEFNLLNFPTTVFDGCYGRPTAVDVSHPGIRRILWQPTGGDTVSDPFSPVTEFITTSRSGTRVLRASIETECGFSQTQFFFIRILPGPQLVGMPTHVSKCPGSKLIIGPQDVVYSAQIASYEWTPATGLSDPNIRNPEADPQLLPATYTLKVTAADGCITESQTTVQAASLPDATSLAGRDLTSCYNALSGSLGMPAQPGLTYSWSPALGLDRTDVAQPNFQYTWPTTQQTTLTYTLTVTNSQGCSAQDSVNVHFNQGMTFATQPNILVPFSNQNPNTIEVCEGETFTIDGAVDVPGAVYWWQTIMPGQASTRFEQNGVREFTARSYYYWEPEKVYRIMLYAYGPDFVCNGVWHVDVYVKRCCQPEGFTAGADRTICANETTQLGVTASPIHTYSWTPAIGLDRTDVAQPQAKFDHISSLPASVTYTLVTTNKNTGCEETTHVTIQLEDCCTNIVADAGADGSGCPGKIVTLGGTQTTTGLSYLWSPATGLNDPSLRNPELTLPANTTGQPINVTYTLKVTGADNCSKTDTVTVTITPTPQILLQNATITYCSTQPVQLGVSVMGNYSQIKWTPATGLNDPNVINPIASPTADTTYEIEVTNLAGCVVREQVTVLVTGSSSEKLAGEDIIACGNSVNNAQLGLAPKLGYTYQWSPTTGLSNPFIANPAVTISTNSTQPETKTYTLKVRTQNGCEFTDTVNVILNGSLQLLPSSNMSLWPGSPTNPMVQVTACPGQVIRLKAPVNSPHARYVWEGINTIPNLHSEVDVTIIQPPSYPYYQNEYVRIYDFMGGCEIRAAISFKILPCDQVNFADAGADVDMCYAPVIIGPATTLANHKYSWQPAAGLSDASIPNPVASPTTTTTYTLTVRDPQGNISTDTVTVNVKNPPVPNSHPEINPMSVNSRILNIARDNSKKEIIIDLCTGSNLSIMTLSTLDGNPNNTVNTLHWGSTNTSPIPMTQQFNNSGVMTMFFLQTDPITGCSSYWTIIVRSQNCPAPSPSPNTGGPWVVF